VALDFTSDPGGLFVRIGRIGYVLDYLNNYQDAIQTALGDVAGQYLSTLRDAYGRVAVNEASFVANLTGGFGTLQQLASDTIIGMVNADNPAAARSLADALAEVRRQMLAGTVTVQSATVGATATADSGNTGTGVAILTTKRGDGLTLELLIAENALLTVSADSYSGGQVAGREPLAFVGEGDGGLSPSHYQWPAGSGATQSVQAVSADTDASTASNLLTNGDLEDWTGATPALDQFTLSGGTWGTDLARNSTTPFRGTYDLRFIAGTAATPSLTQEFGDATDGTAVEMAPLTSYIFNCWMKRAGVVSAGVLTVDLVDGSNTVINDEQGTANSFTKTLSTLGTTFGSVSGTFRLPANPPAVVKLRIRISTALAGADVYMDDLCLAPVTTLYSGGPGLVVFSGATPFVTGDFFTVATTNDRGGASYLATFQSLFDRLFDMRGAGVLLPSSGSPSVNDSLITS
jgi:hypothetical protein